MNADRLIWRVEGDDPPPWTHVAIYDHDTGEKLAKFLLEKPMMIGDTVTISLNDKVLLTLE